MEKETILPREKIIRAGVDTLSDIELIQALLGTGAVNMPIAKLAPKILACIEKNNTQIDYDDLKALRGIGDAKIAVILAAFEIARRLMYCEKRRIRIPADAVQLVSHFAERQQEHFIAILLNGAHESMRIRVVSVGSLNEAIVHPREVFVEAIRLHAAGIILTHNHPSGNVQPSDEDVKSTKRLVTCGQLLGINIIDHIIFSAHTYYSFAEHDML